MERVLPPPGEISFLSVKSDSVTLRWEPPEGLEGPKKFKVTWANDEQQDNLIVKDMYQVELTGLQPGQDYYFTVATVGADRRQSRSVSKMLMTVIPAPRDLTVQHVDSTSLTLRWRKAQEVEHLPQRFLISYHSPGAELLAVQTDDCCRTLTDLRPGTKYTVSVSTVLRNGEQSEPVSTTVYSGVPAPADLTAEQLPFSPVTLCWTKAEGLEQIPHHFLISYSRPGTEAQTTQTEDCYTTLTDLLPGTEYTVSVSTVLKNRKQSEPVSTTINTDWSFYIVAAVLVVVLWLCVLLHFLIKYWSFCILAAVILGLLCVLFSYIF